MIGDSFHLKLSASLDTSNLREQNVQLIGSNVLEFDFSVAPSCDSTEAT